MRYYLCVVIYLALLFMRYYLCVVIYLGNSHLSYLAPLTGNYFRHAQKEKTSFHHVAHIVNMSITKFEQSMFKTDGVTAQNSSHTNPSKFGSDYCFFLVYCQ